MRDALLAGPTLSSNARAKAFWAKVYAKCMSISRRQLANSTAVAAGSRSAGGSKSGLALYVGAWVPAKTWAALVMLPGMAFHTASVAINVIAPVLCHCAQRPRALALRSSNHSTICVRGLSARENWSDTDGARAAAEDMDDGWVDGWIRF